MLKLSNFDAIIDACKADMKRERFFASLAEKPKPHVRQKYGFDWQIWLFWIGAFLVWKFY